MKKAEMVLAPEIVFGPLRTDLAKGESVAATVGNAIADAVPLGLEDGSNAQRSFLAAIFGAS